MFKFTIYSNKYLEQNVQGFYHTEYTGYRNDNNPDYLNDLKNTFDDTPKEKLNNAKDQLSGVLKIDLNFFNKNLTICMVPRAKAENTYNHKQLLFKKVIQHFINEFGFRDGSNYIVRHTDTKTTHLSKSQYGGNGKMPYRGITKDTCNLSNDIENKDILLIDDIYTNSINIDEDAIQTLFDKGAKSVIFYAVGKTV